MSAELGFHDEEQNECAPVVKQTRAGAELPESAPPLFAVIWQTGTCDARSGRWVNWETCDGAASRGEMVKVKQNYSQRLSASSFVGTTSTARTRSIARYPRRKRK